MQKIFLFIILFGAMGISVQSHADLTYTNKKAIAQFNRELALVMLSRAANNKQASAEAKQIYANLAQVLESITINVPTQDRNFQPCKEDENLIAYHNPRDREIYLCNMVFFKTSEDYNVSQALVHEVAHAAGYHDECEATKIEISAANHAKRSNVSLNGYIDSCQISPKFTL